MTTKVIIWRENPWLVAAPQQTRNQETLKEYFDLIESLAKLPQITVCLTVKIKKNTHILQIQLSEFDIHSLQNTFKRQASKLRATTSLGKEKPSK